MQPVMTERGSAAVLAAVRIGAPKAISARPQMATQPYNVVDLSRPVLRPDRILGRQITTGSSDRVKPGMCAAICRARGVLGPSV